MINGNGIDSLTNFQKDAAHLVAQLGETKEPLILTVEGQAKLVVQDVEAYQALVSELEQMKFLAAVRQGLREADQGQSRPAEQVYAEMKAKYDL